MALKDGILHVYPRYKKHQKRESQSSWLYFGLVGEIGFIIVLPMAVGAFIGTRIDRSWGTYPKATLTLLFAGFVVSVVGFVRIIYDLIKRN